MDQQAPEKPKKVVGKPFKPGQSGNPSGRPKVVSHIRDLAQKHGEEALKTVVALMRSEDERVALAAAQVVLDRAYGKPIQQVDVNDTRDMVDLTDADLAAIATAGRERDPETAPRQSKPAGVH